MKNRSFQLVVYALVFLFAFPARLLIVRAQEASPNVGQEKPKVESEEEKKLRKADESRKKKEEEQKRREEKERTAEAKKYQTLSEFAEDLYASDSQFRDQVDDTYLGLQRWHAEYAYKINTSHRKEILLTENEGEVLKLRRALYDNPRVQEYVNRLGQQIVPDDSEKLYSFKVTVDPIPKAYTLSTGTVLIRMGMISVLDNEAQLAYVLAHELAHVYKDHWRYKVMLPLAEAEYNRKQALKRAFWTGIFMGVGQAVGGDSGALVGFKAAQAIGSYYADSALDWNWAQENEADDFALKATLGKSFDIQEVPRLYTTMAQVARSDYRIQLGFLGARSRIRERSDYAQKQINGALQTQYQDALKNNKIKGMSSEFNLIMSELKRDNGIEAFYRDMFQLARMNLQQAVMLRSDDPVAAYYYGRVLKQIGRTKEELDLAQQSLLKAITLDTRNELPDVQLHRALMLMDSKDPGANVEAIAALKTYITMYGRRRATAISNEELVPPNVDVLYGYMRLLGDKTWVAPSVGEILKTNAVNSGGTSSAPPPTIPKIEPASQTLSPGTTRPKRKP
jgi:predicted Zn-dependent protease